MTNEQFFGHDRSHGGQPSNLGPHAQRIWPRNKALRHSAYFIRSRRLTI